MPNTDPATPVALERNEQSVQRSNRRQYAPTAVGRYCFRAEYSGDDIYDAVDPLRRDHDTCDPNGTECFVCEHDPDDNHDGTEVDPERHGVDRDDWTRGI